MEKDAVHESKGNQVSWNALSFLQANDDKDDVLINLPLDTHY